MSAEHDEEPGLEKSWLNSLELRLYERLRYGALWPFIHDGNVPEGSTIRQLHPIFYGDPTSGALDELNFQPSTLEVKL